MIKSYCMSKPARQKPKEAPKFEIDTTKFAWEKRFTDPHIKMIWNDLIKVEPANKEKGQYFGWRIYPDGYREQFEIKHR